VELILVKDSEMDFGSRKQWIVDRETGWNPGAFGQKRKIRVGELNNVSLGLVIGGFEDASGIRGWGSS